MRSSLLVFLRGGINLAKTFKLPLFLQKIFPISMDAHSASISEIREILATLAESQRKTDIQIRESQQKTDDQIRKLFSYNQNRDRELEDMIGEFFLKGMINAGWKIVRIPIRYMYKEDGRYQSEWDGIFYATHSAVKLPRLFFVETKQIMSLAKYKDAKIRLSKTKRFLEKIKWDDVEATGGAGNDFTAMKGIFRVFFTSLPKIELVVGSPFVEAEVGKQLEADGVSCVTIPEDKYVVTLHGIY